MNNRATPSNPPNAMSLDKLALQQQIQSLKTQIRQLEQQVSQNEQPTNVSLHQQQLAETHLNEMIKELNDAKARFSKGAFIKEGDKKMDWHPGVLEPDITVKQGRVIVSVSNTLSKTDVLDDLRKKATSSQSIILSLTHNWHNFDGLDHDLDDTILQKVVGIFFWNVIHVPYGVLKATVTGVANRIKYLTLVGIPCLDDGHKLIHELFGENMFLPSLEFLETLFVSNEDIVALSMSPRLKRLELWSSEQNIGGNPFLSLKASSFEEMIKNGGGEELNKITFSKSCSLWTCPAVSCITEEEMLNILPNKMCKLEGLVKPKASKTKNAQISESSGTSQSEHSSNKRGSAEHAEAPAGKRCTKS